MLERTLVLVDTSYLLASFYNSWEEGARGQLEISLATVVHRLDQVAHSLVDQPVQRQNWYDGIPDSGPHRYQRTLRVIEGVQLRAGQLIEWGERRTQKAVDTLLVADMIQAAYKGQCSDMVLVTGDADMIPGVRVAVDAGVRMHLVGFGWDSISSALRHACDTTTVLDPRTDFHDAMQIRVLEGPIPPKVRTPTATPAHPGEDGHDPDTHESVDLMEVDLRADRAAATSVADETRLTIADEERAADAEELAADEHECAARVENEHDGREAEAGPPPQDAATPAPRPRPEGPAVVTPADLAPKPGPTPQASPPPAEHAGSVQRSSTASEPANGSSRPNPSMMAPHRRPLRSKFVPLPEEVWTSSGEQTPFDVGQQYATWWYEQAATEQQRDEAHLLSGGVLPPAIDRPLLQFACQMLNEFTLTETQRVRLRDGFHEGIRAVLLKHR
ncbi:NYN domain-containing protein [Dietzia sp. HMSC21D01]|uniref:NYN domain-containing protein n=1 Tax=Dietzia cinnamea TaxID=321318 RepID=A0AAW5Q9X3_9ACTN|nr:MULTISPECIES: NYN domain-containing protein [Dietzia]KZO57580.1 NYN domain-containing protein [Dietzia maris]MCT1638832.1 NYN domain-containing protein [Dietzia cinnamea]MCT1711117.1 NYN domain-containing protein [Dietzia cinnamea]MCT1864591.1 NYN domain-containing protein [Dietzia cinnamea]MCT2031654.1 NYN domain-containing protein [Dietzia cinnamea]